MRLPPKNIVIPIVFFSMLVGVAGFRLLKKTKQETAFVAPANNTTQVAVAAATANNTDWQKSLENLSAEYKASHPDADQAAAATTATDTPEDTTETSAFSKQFFTEFMQLQAAGQSPDPQAIANLADKYSSEGLAQTTESKVYVLGDLNIIANPSDAAVKNYGNKLAEDILTNTPQTKDDEFSILQRSLQNSDQTELVKLDPFIAAYAKEVKLLLALPVPQDAADLHLTLLNNLNKVSTLSQTLKKAYSDPLVTLKNLTAYQAAFSDYSDSWNTMSGYFQDANVTYSPKEYGYAFNIGTQ